MARLLLLLLLLFPLALNAATVNDIRTWAGPEKTRVVLDLSETIEHSVFTLDNPARVVIDLERTRMAPKLVRNINSVGLVKRIRSGVRNGEDLRVVFDMVETARPQSFMLRPNGEYGHRLVVDLAPFAAKPAPTKRLPTKSQRPLRIAIDAGHGGIDPGAIGPSGMHEKDVALAVAKKLAYLIEQAPGMEPLMIRTDDYYLGLRERTAKAHEQRADMFISLHANAANAAHAHDVQGAAVFTLSHSGASTEAGRLLAERENSTGLIGGVSLDDKDDLLATVLVDLSRTATVKLSLQLADEVLGHLGKIGKLHKTQVEQAGFVVLKSLDMPSVLVELAFLSNPAEEQLLRSDDYQWQLARALFSGISTYRDEHMPEAPRLTAQARRQHVVRRGDTLSDIAQRYDVSLDTLRSANGLISDRIMVGLKLVVP